MLQGMSHGLLETQGMSLGMYEGMSQSMLQGTPHGSNKNIPPTPYSQSNNNPEHIADTQQQNNCLYTINNNKLTN